MEKKKKLRRNGSERFTNSPALKLRVEVVVVMATQLSSASSESEDGDEL